MRSVLLIDDDTISRELFAFLLNAEGYSVHTYENGDAALAALRADSSQPDAVLIDMQMPGTTGTALAVAIRALCPHCVMLGMSASQQAGVPAGFDGFLLKPFNGPQFTQALESGAHRESASPDENIDLDQSVVATLSAAMPAKQLGELYALSLSDTRKRAAAMRQSLAAGKDDAFRREAHAIKGSAAMLGASAMAGMARQMEEAGISADAPRLLDDLMAAAARLEGILLLRFP
jgi:CheY-like chemotaxis protein